VISIVSTVAYSTVSTPHSLAATRRETICRSPFDAYASRKPQANLTRRRWKRQLLEGRALAQRAGLFRQVRRRSGRDRRISAKHKVMPTPGRSIPEISEGILQERTYLQSQADRNP